MTALSNSYRIQNYNNIPTTGLNNHFGIRENVVFPLDHQSTLFKEFGYLSHANRLEIQRVKSFSELEGNWDSYGAEVMSYDVIDKAIDLIKEVDTLEEDVYFSSPGPNGEIMIQLRKDEKEAELIIYRDRSKYVTFNKNDFEKQGELTNKILPEIIEWLNL